MKDTIIGIDLGTTNSAAAVLKDGKPIVIPLDGDLSMPSCVGLDSAGELVVGRHALNQLVAAPESTVLSIKRSMGKPITTKLGDKSFSPEEISSFILREIKQQAEKYLGTQVTKAVITVPAYFDEAQRKATTHAAELADLEAIRILNEPTAAALAYDANREGNENLLVYDLGGGTFDVSLVVAQDGVVEVQSSHGDTALGGDDFDQCLIDHVVEHFRETHGDDITGDLKAMRRLKVTLEAAKCKLSDEPFVQVQEDYLTEGNHLDLEISREEYEEMIQSYLDKTLTCIHKALDDVKLLPSAVDKVLLVGGSSRTPAVARMIEAKMGITPRSEVNPDLIVAMGAGIQAGNLAGEKSQAILVDITPHTFSTGSIDFSQPTPILRCIPLIKRNAALPASKADVFYTIREGQEEVKVTVYQGERDLPEDNLLIGDFMVQGLDTEAESDSPIIIKFALDLNGMLTVTATEKNTGLEKKVVMDTREGSGNFDLEQARKNIREFTGDIELTVVDDDEGAEDPHAKRLLDTAKNLRKRGESLCEGEIGEDDETEIKELIQASSEAIQRRDWDQLSEHNDTLSDILFYLED